MSAWDQLSWTRLTLFLKQQSVLLLAQEVRRGSLGWSTTAALCSRVPGTVPVTCSHHIILWVRVTVSTLPVKSCSLTLERHWFRTGFLSFMPLVVVDWALWGSRRVKAELVCTHKALKASRYVRNASSSKQQDLRSTQNHATQHSTVRTAKWGPLGTLQPGVSLHFIYALFE